MKTATSKVTAHSNSDPMNYADIVRAEEMRDARAWLEETLAAIRDRTPFRPRAEVRCLQWDGFGFMAIGQSAGGEPICMRERVFTSGLAAAAGSVIQIRLPGPGATFSCLAGVDDRALPNNVIVFSVEGKGKELWRSKPLKAADSTAQVNVDLDGAREFTLKIQGSIVAGYTRGRANWVDLRVILKDGSELVVGERRRQRACFSFEYGDRPSEECWREWTVKEEILPDTDRICLRRITRTDPMTGLQAIVDIKEYKDFPVVEWVARFKNTGKADTPILKNIQSLDAVFPADGGYCFVNHNAGDPGRPYSYQPIRSEIGSYSFGLLEEEYTEYAFAPKNGRPTSVWPYYNLEFPGQKRGVIAVVGWPGQWATRINCDTSSLHFTGGQELTHFKLHPGEEVRTPLSVLMFWRGGDDISRPEDTWRTGSGLIRSQNLWRRWMIACNMPRPGGKLPPPIMPASWGSEMHAANEANQIQFLERYKEEKIQLDYWWMDAGWYAGPDEGKGTWEKTGTWEVDTERFPRGLRAISDHAHAGGIKTLLWFEPERVSPGTWLDKNRPEWLLSSDEVSFKLLDLGNPDARKWLTERVDRIITEEGIDLYRQDFNTDPLFFWRAHDAADRQGITEIRHVEGYLAFWDELRRRHPDMLIDSCASGGRRNDLETARRSVPLHRSDYGYTHDAAKQAMTYGLSFWLPYFGAPFVLTDVDTTYAFRSSLSLSTGIGLNMMKRDLDYDLLRRLIEERRRIVHYFYGDFYPLTPYNYSEKDWIAWQFDRPDLGEGMVQVFRRSEAPFKSAKLKLHALKRQAVYWLTNLDTPDKSVEMAGAVLLDEGLEIILEKAPQAAIWIYAETQHGQ